MVWNPHTLALGDDRQRPRPVPCADRRSFRADETPRVCGTGRQKRNWLAHITCLYRVESVYCRREVGVRGKSVDGVGRDDYDTAIK